VAELDYRGEVELAPTPPRRGRLPVVAAVLLVVILLAASVGLRRYFSLPMLANTRPVAFELRLAETAAGPGFTSATIADGAPARLIYLHPNSIVSNANVEFAEVVEQQGQHVVQFTLDPVGTVRMLEATAAHRGKPLAILIDHRVRAAPVINSQIGQQAVIEAGFTQEEAERIAAGIVAR
jgi:preprotein translocase subunit SecD